MKKSEYTSRQVSYREQLLHQISNRIRQSLELPEILSTAVEEIRAFLEVDRVKVYRFEADGSGEVIAEALLDDRLPSLLNLRFPASDVPPQSRDLFVKARQRVIVDVVAQRQTRQQLDSLETGESLTESDIRHTPVDPCHIQYLLTMGVLSSLIVPILHHRRLWGLLAVHHAQPRPFSESELQIVQLLVDQVSIAIAQSDLLTQARQQVHHEATVNRISHLLHCPLEVAEIRQKVLEAVVHALQGSGGRLYITAEPSGEPAQLYLTGEQPTQSWIEETPIWQELMGLSQPVAALPIKKIVADWRQYEQSPQDASSTATDASADRILYLYTLADLQQSEHLSSLAQAFAAGPIRSIGIIPLQFHSQVVGCLSVFRNGYDTEIWWAGHSDEDERNRMPRSSFEAWREIKADQAPAWTPDEVKLAQSVGLHLYMTVTQKRIESMIRYQASHDALTKLPNRLLFNEQLSLAIVNAQQRDEMLGVAFLDLDRFKTINDTLGHAVGDQLLQQVAHRLQGCLQSGDVIARWGGDEFTLLLPGLKSPDEVDAIAEQILDHLRVPFYLDGQELYITTSLGIALAPYDGEDAETLLKNADAAMYQAKQRGKNTYQLYYEEMHAQALERLSLEADLRKALAKGEFLLHYQPQIDVKTNQLIGLEALLRWQHPQLGWIPPSIFIPIAEESGLICEIGDWVLESACRQMQTWKAAGLPPVRIAVNLSAQQFQQPDLVQSILRTLQVTQVDPNYLEVEITESAAMKDIDFTISTLQQLREIGIRLAIDDFGTGYSSLSALKHFPLHILKIDQSFVRDAVDSSHDAAIVKAVVALGKGLGLEVLAEGVETQEQLDFLRTIQCDSSQGFFLYRPMPPAAIAHLLQRSS